MSLHYRRQGAAIIIFGNTYPYKDQIKALGGRFNGADKNWRVPFSDDNAARIDELCVGAGGGSLGEPSTVTTALPGFSSPSASFFATDESTADVITLADIPPWEISPVAAPVHTPAHAPVHISAPLPSPAAPTIAAAADGLTIRQLMDRLSAAVTSVFPGGVWVIAEVQNMTTRASGIFLDLAEPSLSGHQNATTTVRAMLWNASIIALKMRRGANILADVLQDGLKIRCFCQVSLYKERGSISLTIDDIDPTFTKGALALAREQLLKELRAKGLDQLNKRLVLPAFPFRVGLISADNSRAKSDFLDQLQQGGFPGEVIFRAAPMQGEAVPKEVSQALAELAAAHCDLIVLTRGGGSAADLRWFDAPEIAYAIANCGVPVIAAIGHHDDICVAEEICHLRQKTPTAAADFVLHCFVETRRRIELLAAGFARLLGQRVDEVMGLQAMLSERLSAAATLALAQRRERLSEQSSRLTRMAERQMAIYGERRNNLKNSLLVAAMTALSKLESQLATLERQIVQRDPIPWLKQGWTQLRNAKGLVRDLSDTSRGEIISARLRDGILQLKVEDQQTQQTTTPQQKD